jgi:hypothetical protein
MSADACPLADCRATGLHIHEDDCRKRDGYPVWNPVYRPRTSEPDARCSHGLPVSNCSRCHTDADPKPQRCVGHTLAFGNVSVFTTLAPCPLCGISVRTAP